MLTNFKPTLELEGTANEWQRFDFDLHFVNVVWKSEIRDLVKFNSMPIFDHSEDDLSVIVDSNEWSTKSDVFGMYHIDRRPNTIDHLNCEPLSKAVVDRIMSLFSKQDLHSNMKQLSDIFREPSKTKYSVILHHPVQFECLRQVLGHKRSDFVRALAASHKWLSSGGQTNSDFYKTDNGRFIAKGVSALEFENFQQLAQSYFKYVFASAFNNKETFLGHILAVVEIKVGKEEKKYLMIMENVVFGLKMNEYIKVFDLKGSQMNRFRKSNIRTKTNLDTNYLLERNGDPIVVQMPSGIDFFKILERDVAFLRDKGIVDYSMLLVVHKQDRVIKVGIIDYLRKYDFKKKIEHGFKKIKNFGLDPTIVNPDQYADRFLRFMRTCIVPKSAS